MADTWTPPADQAVEETSSAWTPPADQAVEETAQKKSGVDTASPPIPSLKESDLETPSISKKPISDVIKQGTKNNFLSSDIYDSPKTREAYYDAMDKKGYDKNQIKNYGETLSKLKPFLPSLMQRINDNPDDADALYQMGRIQLALGENKDAASTFSGLIAKEPKQPANYQGLAYAMKMLGDDNQANELVARAKELTAEPLSPSPLNGAISPPQQQQDSQGIPISEDHSGQSFPTQASEEMNTIVSGIEKTNPIVSTAGGIISGLEGMTKALGELPAAISEDARHSPMGMIPSTTLLKLGEAGMHGAFGILQASPEGLLFNSAISGVTLAGGEKPIEYVMEPATKIADALGYVPKSEVGKSTIALLNAVGSILILESPKLAIKMRSRVTFTPEEVQEAREVVEKADPELVKNEIQKAVIAQEPEAVQPLKEKQIKLQDDLNNNLPVMGEDAKVLFQPEIEKIQQQIDTKKADQDQKHVTAAEEAAHVSQFNDEMTTLNTALDHTQSEEGKRIINKKIKQLEELNPSAESAPVPEQSPVTSTDNGKDKTTTNPPEVLNETLQAQTGGETEQPVESATEPPVVSPDKKVDLLMDNTDQIGNDKNPVLNDPTYKYKSSSKTLEGVAEDAVKKLKEVGFKVDGYSTSNTDAGTSHYVNAEDANGEKYKFRISDHSVENINRIKEEYHVDKENVGQQIFRAEKKAFPERFEKQKINGASIDVRKTINLEKPQPDAIQEPSTGSVLQHPQEAAGEKGSERERMEQVEQGNEVAKARDNSNGEGDVQKEVAPTGKIIEPHKEVKTDIKTVAKELGYSEGDAAIYNEIKDIPADEESMDNAASKRAEVAHKIVEDAIYRVDDLTSEIERNARALEKNYDDINRAQSSKLSDVAKQKKIDILKRKKQSIKDHIKKAKIDLKIATKEKESLDGFMNKDGTFSYADEMDGFLNDMVDKIDARLETRRGVKAGSDLFPEDANIPEFKSLHKKLKDQTDESTINNFKSRTAEQVEQSESAIKNIESKADNAGSLSEEELQSGIDAADELINSAKSGKVKKKSSTQGYSGSPQIKTEAEPKVSEPVKASDIIKKLSKELGVPIRTGHVRWGKRLGIFKPHDEVVRNKEGNDLAVTSHEVAHYMDKKLNPDLRNKLYKDELKDLDYDQKKRRPFEGFAEFVRHYLTDDDAAQVAPKFHDYFENTFLKDHPDVAKTIAETKQEINKWREQGAEARMISEIDWDGTGHRKTTFGEWTRKARTRWVDSLGGLKYAMKEMLGNEAKNLRPSDDPVALASAGNKRASAVARAWVMDGMTNAAGEKIGKGLKEIVAPVTDEIKAAIAYTRALRILNRSEKNGDFNANVLQDAQTVVDKYKDNPAFNKFAQEVTQWNASLIDYLADSGRITKDLKKKILDSDLIYIPFKHAIEQNAPGLGGVSKALLNLGVPMKRFNKGGGDIVNPLETMMQNAEKVISTADKNRVVNALVDVAEKNEGMGKWVEEIAAPQVAMKSGLEKLRKQLEGLGADLSDADMDGVLTMFSQAPNYFGKENIGVVYRNGKPKFYEFHPELFHALKGMDQANIQWVTNTLLGKAATGITKAVRVGATGLRAGFQLISNPIRDTWTAALQSQYHSATEPLRSVKGIVDALGNSESHRMFKALGGETAQPLGADRRYTQDLVREILADDVKSKAMNIVKSPVEMLRKVMSFPEAGVRMGEFNAVVKKYQPKIDEAYRVGDVAEANKLKQDRAIEAANAANEVTVNFKRMGSYSSALNQIIFGFNPAIQGVSKMGRSIAERPIRSTLRGAAYLTAPTLALWALNKDEDWYKQLKPWERYAFWHFKIGDTIYKLPKPFEWGYVFGGLPEGVANSLYNDDNYYIKTAIDEAASSLTPNLLPDALKTPGELFFNWDLFRNQPIIPTSEENLLPPLQYQPQTSSLAKELGDVMNIAPVKIDHLLNGYTGGLAGDILNGFHKDYKEKADIPIIGRLFLRRSDALLNGDYVQRFYNMADFANKIHQSIKQYPKLNENATMYEMKKTLRLNDEAARLYSNYDAIGKIKETLQSLRAMQKKIELMKIDPDMKSRLLDEVGTAAVKLVTPIVEGNP